MSIQTITIAELRRMEDQEGLVLQGCGGDPKEWLDGMNTLLTEAGILKKGTAFENIYAFENQGHTCLLFPFTYDPVQLHVSRGRLIMEPVDECCLCCCCPNCGGPEDDGL